MHELAPFRAARWLQGSELFAARRGPRLPRPKTHRGHSFLEAPQSASRFQTNLGNAKQLAAQSQLESALMLVYIWVEGFCNLLVFDFNNA